MIYGGFYDNALQSSGVLVNIGKKRVVEKFDADFGFDCDFGRHCITEHGAIVAVVQDQAQGKKGSYKLVEISTTDFKVTVLHDLGEKHPV